MENIAQHPLIHQDLVYRNLKQHGIQQECCFVKSLYIVLNTSLKGC